MRRICESIIDGLHQVNEDTSSREVPFTYKLKELEKVLDMGMRQKFLKKLETIGADDIQTEVYQTDDVENVTDDAIYEVSVSVLFPIGNKLDGKKCARSVENITRIKGWKWDKDENVLYKTVDIYDSSYDDVVDFLNDLCLIIPMARNLWDTRDRSDIERELGELDRDRKDEIRGLEAEYWRDRM